MMAAVKRKMRSSAAKFCCFLAWVSQITGIEKGAPTTRLLDTEAPPLLLGQISPRRQVRGDVLWQHHVPVLILTAVGSRHRSKTDQDRLVGIVICAEHASGRRWDMRMDQMPGL